MNYSDLPLEVRIDQLTEEAAELAAATSKLSRKLRKVNPTPKSLQECIDAVIEEYTDVVIAAESAGFKVDQSIRERKIRRWNERITNEKD